MNKELQLHLILHSCCMFLLKGRIYFTQSYEIISEDLKSFIDLPGFHESEHNIYFWVIY